MNSNAAPLPQPTLDADETIGAHAELLSAQLQALSEAIFPPTSQKSLRRFTSGEAARLMRVSDSTLRKMTLAGEGPLPDTASNGRRLYTLGQINAATNTSRSSRSPISRAARARPQPRRT